MTPTITGLFAQVVTVTDLIANLPVVPLIGVCIAVLCAGKILMTDMFTATSSTATGEADFIFVARYRAPKDAYPTTLSRGSQDPVIRWCSVYGTQEEAYRGAATFIRDALLNSTLRSSADQDVIKEIEDSVRSGDVESVISLWNEEFPTHKVKVYKGVAL